MWLGWLWLGSGLPTVVRVVFILVADVIPIHGPFVVDRRHVDVLVVDPLAGDVPRDCMPVVPHEVSLLRCLEVLNRLRVGGAEGWEGA